MRLGESGRSQHFGRPSALGYIDPERAGRIGGITRFLARHEQSNVVLGQQDRLCRIEAGGLVLAHPQKFRSGEARHCDVAGDLTAGGLSALEIGALLFAAAVVPQDCGTKGTIFRVEKRCAVHLSAQTYSLNRTTSFGGQRLHRRLSGIPPIEWILLGPAGLRSGNRQRKGRLFDDRIMFIHDDGLHARRADINA
jgi:hypothetical protein